MKMYRVVPIFMMVVVTDKVVGRFEVAAEDVNKAMEVARYWAAEHGYRPTEIRYTPKQKSGLPYNVFVPR